MLTALILLCSIGTTDCRQIAESRDQSELHFSCLTYGMEEAAKHPVPGGKFVKVAREDRIAPRIIQPLRRSAFWSLSERALLHSA